LGYARECDVVVEEVMLRLADGLLRNPVTSRRQQVSRLDADILAMKRRKWGRGFDSI